MLAAFYQAIITFVWGKVIGGIAALFGRVTEYFKRKKIISEKEELAISVKKLADEIRALNEAGQPVPPELEMRLRDESRKLIESNFGSIPN